MSGIDHYREAERLIEVAHKCGSGEIRGEYLRFARHLYEHAQIDAAPQPVLTIPWPPSAEMLERVARTLAALDGRSWDALLPIRQGDYRAKARAVLDAIGGDR